MSGNHLIPINDKSISINKEYLSIKKTSEIQGENYPMYYEVNIYYEFYNHGDEKNIIVGFEARSPVGDVDLFPIEKGHPFMSGFTVEMNGSILDHEIAYVLDSTYYNAGVVRSERYEKVIGDLKNNEGLFSDFYYVYHFNAVFKKGINKIQHSYRFTPSSYVYQQSIFNYVLTSINSWGNGIVEDFTMVIDNGDFSSFGIESGFFNNLNDWFVAGIGNLNYLSLNVDSELSSSDWLSANIRNGVLVYKKNNFKPHSDLHMVELQFSMGDLMSNYFMPENYSELGLSILPFSPLYDMHLHSPKNDFDLKILRNLPYARRGYIFKSPDLMAFFKKFEWYMPDPNYIPDASRLLPNEVAFLKSLKSGN